MIAGLVARGRPMATTLQATADARPECIRPLRNLVEELALEAGFSDSDAYAVKVCVGEALSNAVLHAYPTGAPGPVTVSLREDEKELEVAVADEGRGVYEMRHGVDLHLGLTLITRMSQHCTLTAAADGTTVEMVFSRRHGERRGDADTRRLRSMSDLDLVFCRAA